MGPSRVRGLSTGTVYPWGKTTQNEVLGGSDVVVVLGPYREGAPASGFSLPQGGARESPPFYVTHKVK